MIWYIFSVLVIIWKFAYPTISIYIDETLQLKSFPFRRFIQRSDILLIIIPESENEIYVGEPSIDIKGKETWAFQNNAGFSF